MAPYKIVNINFYHFFQVALWLSFTDFLPGNEFSGNDVQ